MSITIRLTLLAGALAMLAGCSGDTALPVLLDGSYTLNAAAGHDLPATVVDAEVAPAADGFHLRIDATEGTLRLTADGRYDERLVHHAYVDGQLSGIDRRSDHGTFTVRGDSIRFTSDYLQGVQFSGVRSGATLHVRQDATGEGAEVVYRFGR
jgi:hypothetical protein